jgi:hypothetical protein
MPSYDSDPAPLVPTSPNIPLNKTIESRGLAPVVVPSSSDFSMRWLVMVNGQCRGGGFCIETVCIMIYLYSAKCIRISQPNYVS